MATSGKPLTDYEQQRIKRLREDRELSIREVAKEEGISTRTVQKYLKIDSSRSTNGRSA